MRDSSFGFVSTIENVTAALSLKTDVAQRLQDLLVQVTLEQEWSWDPHRRQAQGSARANILRRRAFGELQRVRNMLTRPKPRNGPRHTKRGESETFNDGLARPGVWWAGTGGAVKTSTLVASTQIPPSVPHWLGTMGCTLILEVWL